MCGYANVQKQGWEGDGNVFHSHFDFLTLKCLNRDISSTAQVNIKHFYCV